MTSTINTWAQDVCNPQVGFLYLTFTSHYGMFSPHGKESLFQVQFRQQYIHKNMISSFCFKADQTQSQSGDTALQLVFSGPLRSYKVWALWAASAWKERILVTKMMSLPNLGKKMTFVIKAWWRSQRRNLNCGTFCIQSKADRCATITQKFIDLGISRSPINTTLIIATHTKKVLLWTEYPCCSIHIRQRNKK